MRRAVGGGSARVAPLQPVAPLWRVASLAPLVAPLAPLGLVASLAPLFAPLAPLGLIALLALLSAVPLAATAAPSAAELDQAKQYFEGGKQAYAAAQYVPAIAAFEEAQRLAPLPAVAFSLAQAYRLQFVVDHDPAKLRRAVELYRGYVADVPRGGRRDHAVRHLAALDPQLAELEQGQRGARGPGLSPAPAATQLMVFSRTRGATASIGGSPPVEVPVVRDVEAGPHRIEVSATGYFPAELTGAAVKGRLTVIEVPLKERPATVAVSGPDGAQLHVDGSAVGFLPLARPVELAAGRHALSVSEPGSHVFSRELDLQRGEEAKLSAELSTTGQRIAARWLLVGSGVALVAGGASTGLALTSQADATRIIERRDAGSMLLAADVESYNSLVQQREQYRTVSIGLLGTAAGLGLIGAVLWLTDSSDEAIARAPLASPTPEPLPEPIGEPLLDPSAAP